MRKLPGILVCCLWAGVVAAQDAETGNEAAEVRILRAWFRLEDPVTRTESEQVFRDALDDENLGEELKTRAAIGLGRIERLDGRAVESRKRLEALLPRTADRPELRRILLKQIGPPRWYSAVRVIYPQTRYLDLDSGGATSSPARGPRGGPEMESARFLVPTVEDAKIADLVPRMSGKPWHRLRTDEGNLSLVQVLSTSPYAVVRFITRIGGAGELLPPPESPFCIGYNSKIEVWWRTEERYVRYRVERRIGPLDPWKRVKEFEAPPFIDRAVDAGRRFGYRIIGITPEGYEGLPATMQGTVRSRGVTRGQLEIEQGRNARFDLMLGEKVSRGWDLNIQGIYPQGAMIQNFYSSPIFAFVRNGDQREPLSPWDATVTNQWQLKSGDRFLVPLYGGGVARCSIQIEKRKNGRLGAIIDYEVYGDADVFPDPPRITTRETDQGIEIHAEADEPYRIGEVVVKELISGSGPWAIELDGDGNGIDANAKSDEVREYSAVGIDPHGRRTLAGSALVVRMPDKAIAGEFKIHNQQGFSFARRGVVSAAKADLFIQQLNPNLDRIVLIAPYGIMNLRNAFDWNTHKIAETQVFDRVVGLENKEQNLPLTQITIQKRNLGDGVLVLRTRHKGWVKLVLSERDTKTSNWTQRLVTFRYVYNARSPRFKDDPSDVSERGGVLFAGLKSIEQRAKILTEWKNGWNVLSRDGSFRRRFVDIDPAGGSVADADEVQEVLLEQNSFKKQETARYSFSLATRDRPEGNLLASVWDIRWQGEHFHARLSGNDQSTVTDLGRMYWTRLHKPAQVLPWTNAAARVRMGHIYLHRKATGNALGAPTLFRVTGLEPWKRLQIEWVTLRDGKLRASPGLTLDEATTVRVRELLGKLPSDDKGRAEAIGGNAALRTYRKMHTERIASIGLRDGKLSEFIERLTLVTGLKFVLEGDVGAAKLSLFRSGTNAHSLVMDIVDGAELEWRIDKEGRIHLRPRVLAGPEEKEAEAAEQRRAEAREAERKRKEAELRAKKLEALSDVREALRAAIIELETRRAAATKPVDETKPADGK